MEYLPELLWAYRTTCKSATRETPFALAFGTEAVAPIEVGLESPRIKFVNTERNELTLHLNLDLLEEKHEQALKRAEDYQRKIARYYDRKVRPNSFKPSDLVLKKLLPTRKDPTHGKLGANWEGPYIVSRVIRPGNYELQTEEGKSYNTPGMPSTSSGFTHKPPIILINKTQQFYFRLNNNFRLFSVYYLS